MTGDNKIFLLSVAGNIRESITHFKHGGETLKIPRDYDVLWPPYRSQNKINMTENNENNKIRMIPKFNINFVNWLKFS